MRTAISVGVWMLVATMVRPPAAAACGGLFCGQPQPLQQQQPVDQRAERILFRVNDDSVTMVVQISYSGSAPDFAWVLPLGQVPDKKSLKVFPQRGLNVLDANTSLRFIMPVCFAAAPMVSASAALPAAASAGSAAPAAPPPVTVDYQAEVGPYDVAAVESQDPMALFMWLQDNGYNVNESMLPYIRTYTDEGMKFLALKLQKDKDSSDVQPLRFDLPGKTPSIPLRMTGLAAEPEMSILVFVAADRRHDGANWPSLEIKDEQISWRINSGLQTNWEALLARGVDEAGGQGWVTEFAGPAQPIVQNLTFTTFSTAEEMEAVNELLDVIESAPYITRLHTRLSAEEMTIDPSFKRVTSVDVSSTHQLVRAVEGVDQCGAVMQADPCSFASCGAGGLCRAVSVNGQLRPACACVDGATARTTVTPPGMAAQADTDASVACQDLRMSFSNPGATTNGVTATDPCLNFDCGPSGTCAPVNMTPTCICDHGYVAVGGIETDGSRTTTCTRPMVEVPASFYTQRLPDLPDNLPGGREVTVDRDKPVVKPKMGDLSSRAVPDVKASAKPATPPGSTPVKTAQPVAGATATSGALPAPGSHSSGCAVGGASSQGVGAAGFYALLALGWLHTRRRKVDSQLA